MARTPAPFLALVIISFSAASILFSGCGIDSFAALEAPDPDFVIEPLIGETRFIFDHNTSNSGNDFLGYELYYKFYTLDQESTRQSDVSAIEGTTVPGTSTLVSRGYRRIRRPGGERPVIGIDPADKPSDITITIDMAANPYPEVYLDIYAPAWVDDLVREVVEEGQTDPIEKGFLDIDIVEGDSDVPSSYVNGTSIDMAVFVIAYGIDAGDLREIYSGPTYLGYVRI